MPKLFNYGWSVTFPDSAIDPYSVTLAGWGSVAGPGSHVEFTANNDTYLSWISANPVQGEILFGISSGEPYVTPSAFIPGEYYHGRFIDSGGNPFGFPAWSVPISAPPDGIPAISPFPQELSIHVPDISDRPYGALFGWLDVAAAGWILEYTYEFTIQEEWATVNTFNPLSATYMIDGLEYLTIPEVLVPDIPYFWRILADGISYRGPNWMVPFGVAPTDDMPVNPDEGPGAYVNEPSDLRDNASANIGTKLRAAASAIRQARAHLRDWNSQ